MSEDAPIDLAEAAALLDMTPAGVRAMTIAHHIPCEKVGRKVFVERAVIEAIPDLKEQFGRKWHEHAPWNGGRGVKASSKIVGSRSPELSINQRLVALAKAAREAGELETALKLQEILLEQYDFA
jgi:hypothetical protein